MSRRPPQNQKNRSAVKNAVRISKRSRRVSGLGKRLRSGEAGKQGPFIPSEDWYDPTETGTLDYEIVTQDPGEGYAHVVTADDIEERLSMLPDYMLTPLDTVQLSRMTHKKKTFPCYGMQWGSALYLYPIETGLIEHFDRPPRPALLNETRMFGGCWKQEGKQSWTLTWPMEAIRDFYLNNILIHELGHLLDTRNSSYTDRERYAEWFAIHYGYKPTRRTELAHRAAKKIVRRHHSGL